MRADRETAQVSAFPLLQAWRENDMNAPQIDETTVRQLIEIISAHASQLAKGGGPRALLQLCRISPHDDKSVMPSRFNLDDIEDMVRAAVDDATAGYNAYMETSTVRPDLKGSKRGGVNGTCRVFGLVADCDADKNKGGNVTVRPSLAIETSPGNFHLWYLFTRAVPAAQAKLIGDAIRASSGTDQDTGVITQCYRVPGTPNFPSAAKQARGRTTVEPTRIFEHTGRLWDPDELLAAFSTPSPAQSRDASRPSVDEATLPDDLLEVIRNAGDPNADRSALFHRVVRELARRRWTVEDITALLEKYPDGIGKKYSGRLHKEVERSYAKVANGSFQGAGITAGAKPTPGTGTASGPSGSSTAPHVLPTIRITPGQLSRAVVEAERALVASGSPIFSRAGTLVLPVSEIVSAADGRKTRIARLRSFCVDSLMEWVADAALFQRYDRKRKLWTDIDPPHQVVRMLLVREGRWDIPRISSVITTPTLRADGSLLIKPGYDSRTELYLLPGGLSLPSIPEHPTPSRRRKPLSC
jgi:hypothetical protein